MYSSTVLIIDTAILYEAFLIFDIVKLPCCSDFKKGSPYERLDAQGLKDVAAVN